MPLLFSIAIHATLDEVAAHLEYFWTMCSCFACPLFKLLRESLDRIAGIRLHEGKTKGTGAGLRQRTSKKGEEAWQPEGLKVLGTSIGSPQFTTAKLRERVGDERDAIPTVKNLQCAWQLLLQSANYQANHTLRTTTTTADGQPWRKSRKRTLRARSPLDDRWIGVVVSNQVRSGGVLGVVGRRLGHDQPETQGSPSSWCG